MVTTLWKAKRAAAPWIFGPQTQVLWQRLVIYQQQLINEKQLIALPVLGQNASSSERRAILPSNSAGCYKCTSKTVAAPGESCVRKYNLNSARLSTWQVLAQGAHTQLKCMCFFKPFSFMRAIRQASNEKEKNAVRLKIGHNHPLSFAQQKVARQKSVKEFSPEPIVAVLADLYWKKQSFL
eukprot:1157940-Pelagomonas_calceolata.AAC.2